MMQCLFIYVGLSQWQVSTWEKHCEIIRRSKPKNFDWWLVKTHEIYDIEVMVSDNQKKNLTYYFNKHVCLSIRPCVCVRSPKFFFAKSTNVTNRCCHICFSDDKNVFGIITWPPGGSQGAQKGPGGSHQKPVKWKNVINKLCCLCFSVDENAFGVPPPRPPGFTPGSSGARSPSGGASKGPKGLF